jgi:fumarate reductase flavoprotein subunit
VQFALKFPEYIDKKFHLAYCKKIMRQKQILVFLLYFTLLLVFGCSKPANRENSAIIYRSGTYSASAEGYGGALTVEVDFSGNSILAVRIIEHNETQWIGDQAVASLPDIITEDQGWDVDIVTGATITSEAIKLAVKDCIEKAVVKNEEGK